MKLVEGIIKNVVLSVMQKRGSLPNLCACAQARVSWCACVS